MPVGLPVPGEKLVQTGLRLLLSNRHQLGVHLETGGHFGSAHSQTTQPAQTHPIRTGGLRRRLTIQRNRHRALRNAQTSKYWRSALTAIIWTMALLAWPRAPHTIVAWRVSTRSGRMTASLLHDHRNGARVRSSLRHAVGRQGERCCLDSSGTRAECCGPLRARPRSSVESTLSPPRVRNGKRLASV